jgi:hypothetical protein
MPVQPMKIITAAVTATGDPNNPGLTPEEVVGAGVSVGVIVFFLGLTGFIGIFNWIPSPVVRGLQVSAIV